MAEDVLERLDAESNSVSSLMPFFFFKNFNRKTEILSFLLLCVAKMPFIPPVSIARSVSGLTGKERATDNTSSANSVAKAKIPREDKSVSVKERLT